nr:MAG TPA: hypothetical protein [Caudoviricetes sp.]
MKIKFSSRLAMHYAPYPYVPIISYHKPHSVH